jgi:tripartite-type tricarboxylate transporter receptor subunit TctC
VNSRRSLLRRLGNSALMVLCPPLSSPPLSSTLLAQTRYPERPITLLVPYAAGGGTDTVARVFAEALAQKLNGTIVVINRPGAGGNLATDAASSAKPDGYTLLIGNQGPMVVNTHLFRNMASDPEKTLEPIVMIADVGLVVVVNPRKHPFKTLTELIDALKKDPGAMTYGSASNASASHLATLMLAHVTGIKASHVPYRGAGPAVVDMLGGHLDFMITSIPSVVGQIETGMLTALAVTGERRSSALPNVPTALEAGVPGYVSSAWYGLLAPKGIPADVKQTLETAAIDVLQIPSVVAKISEDGATPSGMRSGDFRAFLGRERATWAEVIKAANLSLD